VKNKNSTLAFVFGALLVLSGCESLDLDSLEKNQLIGSLGAAAGCAILTKQTGGDDEQVAAAAIVCGVVGYAVTNKLENNRKKFESDEEFYSAETERIAEYDATLAEDIKVSEADLQAAQLQIDEVAAKTSRSEADQKNLVAINNDLQERQTRLVTELEVAQENLSYQKGLNLHMQETTGSVSPDAENQLAELEISVQELNELVGAHEQQSASLGSYL
jgi:hypothetical protein